MSDSHSKLIPLGKLKGLLFIALLVVFGCEDNTSNNYLRGKVIDNNGSPVDSVAILLSYYYEIVDSPVEDSSSNPINPVISFSYELPNQTHVTLWIERECDNELIITLVDEVHNAGIFSVQWDKKNNNEKFVTSGVYLLYLNAGDYSNTKNMLVLYDYSGYSFDSIEHNSITNNSGNFSLSQDCMPFGSEGVRTNEVGEFLGYWHVTKYVKIWAIHDSYATVFIDSVYIDSDSGAEVTIQFE